jgi:F-box-like
LPSDPSSPSSSRTASPSPTRPSTPLSRSWIHAHSDPEVNRRTPATFWNNRNKGKARNTGFFSRSSSQSEYKEHISFSDLDPLDDDDGELIDDEGCFIDVRAITGIGKPGFALQLLRKIRPVVADILALLPPELALHILLLLSSSASDSTSGATPKGRSALALSPITEQEEALHALLACRAVSHTWRRLASDNAVWRALFVSRWSVDLDRATPEALMQHAVRNPSHKPLGPTWDFDWGDDHPRFWESKSILPKGKQPAFRGRSRDGLRDRSIFLCPRRISYITTLSSSPLQLDWRVLYRERLELDRRWMGTAPTPTPHSSYLESLDDLSESKENIKPFEPTVRRLEGHTDRCVLVDPILESAANCTT